MIEVVEKLRVANGEPEPVVRRYHRRHEYHRFGGTRRLYLCGPMYEENDQEYFVHRISS